MPTVREREMGTFRVPRPEYPASSSPIFEFPAAGNSIFFSDLSCPHKERVEWRRKNKFINASHSLNLTHWVLWSASIDITLILCNKIYKYTIE